MNPNIEYARRLDLRRAAVAGASRRERTVSNLRLALFVAILLLGWFAFGSGSISGWWTVPPILAFVSAVAYHDRLIRSREHYQRAVAFYERGIARVENRWQSDTDDGGRFLEPNHPYAGDLDLFGPASLYQRVSCARTESGERTLASWLLHPADSHEVESRQGAVRELAAALDLREDLAILGEDVRTALRPELLIDWAEAPPVPFSRVEQLFASALALLSIVAVVLAFPSLIRSIVSLTNPEYAELLGSLGVFDLASLTFLVVLPLSVLFAARLRPRVLSVTRTVERAGEELRLLSRLLDRLGKETFESPRLVQLREQIHVDGHPASDQISRLRKWIDLLDSKRNQFFAPIAALLLWETHIAFGIERWRAQSGGSIGRWLQTMGEMEALASLAGFTFERPDCTFPEIADGTPRFVGTSVGHPLIDPAACVRNDVDLGETRLLIVSGSNMSGKSTLLRTIGTNAVLALAGAPVFAGRLRLTPLRLGASIRIHDSLQEGSSRFYAEITRLKQIVELARSGPLLFLLDEIMHGTNSHDRRIGAEAVVTSLVQLGAIGLVTTHDLALARIAERPDLDARNVHFEDHIEEGRVLFDYRMRDGVVTKSNALALMRAVGLEVGG